MEHIVIIGAGPAGLSAAYELSKRGGCATILEAGQQIGGLSKTVEFEGFRFDLGGHRFFTKIPEIRALWDELLGHRFVVRGRRSRILYRKQFFDYPLRPLATMKQLGLLTALGVASSYAWAQLCPRRPEDNLENWISNRFGWRMYEMFFKTYTEKIWGMPCRQISADWGAQRIRGLSLWRALTEPLRRGKEHRAHSLIEEFHYPPRGPQEMWDELARRVVERGHRILTGHRVQQVKVRGNRVSSVEVLTADNKQLSYPADAVINTMPLHELALALEPSPPADVVEAAQGLGYRSYLTVCLILDTASRFDDNWIYVHSPDMRMGRLQNYGNWSEQMVPEAGKSGLGLEYFAWEGDDLWTAANDQIVALGVEELDKLRLMPPDSVRSGYVVRSPCAYPVYDPGYQQRVATIRAYLATLPRLQSCGRGGLHRYNNMDHAMITGVFAARNLCGEHNDVWSVNLEAEYGEEQKRSGS